MIQEFEITVQLPRKVIITLLCKGNVAAGKGLLKLVSVDMASLPSNIKKLKIVQKKKDEFVLPKDTKDFVKGLKAYLKAKFSAVSVSIEEIKAQSPKPVKAKLPALEQKPGPVKAKPEPKVGREIPIPTQVAPPVASKSLTKPSEGFVRFPVYYGTNRAKAAASGAIYGTTRGTDLKVGLCEVSIPENHKAGDLERPQWFEALVNAQNPQKHFTVLTNTDYNRMTFLEKLKSKINQTSEHDMLLFIHGFNVDFQESILRTAQLGFDLSFKGVVSCYSWPSAGKMTGYVADMDSARLSANYLANFLQLIFASEVKKLHIIAHSMGNVVLTEALLKLKAENKYPHSSINQIVLAAPDIDKDIFTNLILPSINSTNRITLYASDKDKALLASEQLRLGYDRLGQGGEKILVTDGIETVDASSVDTSLLGHGYFSDSRLLLNDLFYVLKNIPPSSRNLDVKMRWVNDKEKLYYSFGK